MKCYFLSDRFHKTQKQNKLFWQVSLLLCSVFCFKIKLFCCCLEGFKFEVSGVGSLNYRIQTARGWFGLLLVKGIMDFEQLEALSIMFLTTFFSTQEMMMTRIFLNPRQFFFFATCYNNPLSILDVWFFFWPQQKIWLKGLTKISLFSQIIFETQIKMRQYTNSDTLLTNNFFALHIWPRTDWKK